MKKPFSLSLAVLFFLLAAFRSEAAPGQFITIWNTSNSGVSGSNQITIPGSGTYTVEWEELYNPSNFGDTVVSGVATIDFPSGGTYMVSIDNGLTEFSFNNGGDKEKLISLEQWGSNSWNNLAGAFYGCSNLIYNAYDTPSLPWSADLSYMFAGCTNFNGDIGSWNMSSASNLSHMFYGATSFNQSLSGWDVSGVSNMSGMFSGAAAFNQDIGAWNVSSVTDMNGMFEDATTFNQDIGAWVVGSVTDMSNMFEGASAFNQNISGWSFGSISDMSDMFRDAVAFNQPIGSWIALNTSNMAGMLAGATAFNQDLGSLGIGNVYDMANMLDNCGLSQANYEYTLMGWIIQAPQYGVSLGAAGLTFCEAADVRLALINTHNWSISGDRFVSCNSVFTTTWKTDNPGTSSTTQITIPGEGTYTVGWEEEGNPSNAGSTIGTDAFTLDFPTAGTYRVWIDAGLDRIAFNNGGDKQKLLTIERWGTDAWTSMAGAFHGCSNLTYSATDAPDLTGLTNMSYMFAGCSLFNGDIGAWDVSWVTDMTSLFSGASSFDQDIGAWSVNWVTSMTSMFEGATAFNQNIGMWNVGSVTEMVNMFKGASAFNQDIGTWSVGTVTSMAGMFEGATSFNQDITNWDMISLTNVSNMFRGATSFNQNIGNWSIFFGASDLSGMLDGATAFNQNLGNLNITNAASMDRMLDGTGISLARYDSTLLGWASQFLPYGVMFSADGLEYCAGSEARLTFINTNGWTISGDQFVSCNSVFITTWKTDNPGTSNPDQITIPGTGSYMVGWEEVGNPSNTGNTSGTGSVTVQLPAAGIFKVWMDTGLAEISFNNGGDRQKLLTIEQWGTGAWTSLAGAFRGCSNLTYAASDVPDLSALTDVSYMFADCPGFNGNIGSWNVSTVQNMSHMFSGASTFNQDIGSWNVLNVVDMSGMFKGDSAFNQNISGWLVMGVSDMSDMFSGAVAFNQDISSWTITSTGSTARMFEGATSFNQPLGYWIVSSVSDMSGMFAGATSFNQDITGWFISATNLSHMFDGASAFNQNLAGWSIANVTSMSGMLDGSGLSVDNYDNTLTGWAYQIPNIGVDLGAAGLEYCNASAERQILMRDYNWTISGDRSSFCNSMFVTVWDSRNPGTSTSSALDIPGTGVYAIDWEEVGNPANSGSTQGNGLATVILPSPGIYRVGIDPDGFSGFAFSNTGDKEKLLEIEQWGDILFGSMAGAFHGCTNLTCTATDVPNMSWVTDMSSAFEGCTHFNGDIGGWNVQSVSNMAAMFRGASAFNRDIGSWNVTFVNDMTSMFEGASSFNQDISSWSVINVSNLAGMFKGASAFNQNIGGWTLTLGVFDMSEMFSGASSFNQNIGAWDVDFVNDMSGMFEGATAFNQNIGSWDVNFVTDMSSMFKGATSFNQNIGGWKVDLVGNMASMFEGASSFDQDILGWNVGFVTDMSDMFSGATSFNQNLGSWIVQSVGNMSGMFDNSGLSPQNYENALIGWAAQSVATGVSVGASGMEYCDDGEAARNELINSFGWSFSGDVKSCSFLPVEWLSLSATPLNGQVKVDWSTATEVNSDYFGVERSTNQQMWQEIGTVKAAGISAIPVSYAFTDAQPAIGSNFYRLKQVDLNGGFAYTPVVEALTGENLLRAYPNPVRDVLHLELSQANWQGELYDAQGKRVAVWKNLSGNTTIETRNLPEGTYLLKLTAPPASPRQVFIVKQ
jgi:surface protein